MITVVADTHALLWFLGNDPQLSKNAAKALEEADHILIPSVSLVEITYLIEKNRLIPAVFDRILAELERMDTPLLLAPLDLGVVLAMEGISRLQVPDMPDRIVAATAAHHCVPLITRDRQIQRSGIVTIW